MEGIPTIDEFKRLKTYACRIRRIAYLPYARHKDTRVPQDQKALTALRARFNFYHKFLDQPLFPNLRQLEFVDARHAIHCLNTFQLTKTISLSLFWDDSGSDVHFNPALRDLFLIIEQRALNMEELDLGSSQSGVVVNTTHGSQVLSALVCKMSGLRGLATGSQSLNLDALRHLASLSRLHKLQISNTSKDILESIGTLHCAVFSELQQLTLRETDIPSFIRLIAHLKPLRLQALTLFVEPNPTPAEIHSIFSALEKSTQHANLHRVVLKLLRRPANASTVPFRRGVDASILEPLLSFPNLTVVELNLPCLFDIEDEQVRAMAEAWPQLRRLQLGSLSGFWEASFVTCTGILALVRNCPELEYLALPFTASGDPVPLRSSLTPADVNKRITCLYAGKGEMRYVYPKRVLQFLRYIFPRLCGVDGPYIWDMDLVPVNASERMLSVA